MKRRGFLFSLLGLQNVVMSGTTTQTNVSKLESKFKCPLGHANDFNRFPGTPLPVHNGDEYFPAIGWLPTYKQYICQECGVVFVVREQPR
jgi:hypothetical protein